MMNKLFRIVTILVATYGAGLVGYLFVRDAHAWYSVLLLPRLAPPDLAFPIIWGVVYALMTCSATIVWLDKQNTHTEGWLRYYFVHLLFNGGWTMFFFGFHTIFLSVLTSLFLSFYAFCLAVSLYEIDRRATILFLPYVAWIFFVTYLTIRIWTLN